MADALALVLFLAMATLGWFRGFLVQVAGLVILGMLWFFFDAWFPPVEGLLAKAGGPLAEYGYLRKLVGFLVGWLGSFVFFAVIELAFRRGETAQAGWRLGGVLVGATKGVLYVVALAWIVETVTLWDKPAHEPAPRWLRESQIVQAVAPWNPVRVFALQRAVERKLARDELRSREEERARLDPAAAAVTPDGEPAPEEKRSREAPITLLEDSDKARALYRASPMRALMDETASLHEWQGRGYGDLIRDPEVRALLRDADIADLLMGE